MIWAQDKNRLIGAKGKMPWHLPSEVTYFREVTEGNIILYGRKTFESFIDIKPLPNRVNWMMSRSHSIDIEGVTVFAHIDDVLAAYSGEIALEKDLWIIGGTEIYELFLTLADEIYITEVEGDYAGDTYAPKLDRKTWKKDHDFGNFVCNYAEACYETTKYVKRS